MTGTSNTWGDRIAALFVEPGARARAAAVTGLVLTAFAVLHAVAILFVPAGAARFDPLAEAWRGSWTLRLVEVGLATAFALHVVLAVLEVRHHRRGAPEGQRLRSPRLLVGSGALLAGFLIWHLAALRFGVRPDGHGVLGLHDAVMAELRHPLRALGYAAAGAGLGLHVAAGLRVSLDTLRPDARGPLHPALAGVVATGLLGVYVGVPLWAWLA